MVMEIICLPGEWPDNWATGYFGAHMRTRALLHIYVDQKFHWDLRILPDESFINMITLPSKKRNHF